jgi:virulence factor Mce-like protein
MRNRGASSVLSNPVLVGAVTVLVVIVAVFLAYNANKGLPFVPTVELETVVPDAYKLVAGNEVREGGFRIGVVNEIKPRKLPDGSAGAVLSLKLDKKASPIQADSKVRIRPRSALGLKYVEFDRGTAKDTLADGDTITVDDKALTIELEDFFNIFDSKTRANVQANLEGYGNGFAGRGASLNQAFASLPQLFADLPPVMRVLADPDTKLARFFKELGDAARISAPDAELIADGFAAGADTFEALGRDPEALKATIEKSPGTLAVGTESFRAQRPFLRDLALVSADLRGVAKELRGTAPPLTDALRTGIAPLRRTPALNRRLGDTLQALDDLTSNPGTDRAITGLVATMTTLNPQLRYLGPYVTVCNYWNYWWTFLADHLTDEEGTGTIQRIQAKTVSGAQDPLDNFGAAQPIPGLHAQFYAAAIDDQGNADCENGQRGYPTHLANGIPSSRQIVVDSTTPGNQGPTFKGRAKVPAGETFSRLPSDPRFRP